MKALGNAVIQFKSPHADDRFIPAAHRFEQCLEVAGRVILHLLHECLELANMRSALPDTKSTKRGIIKNGEKIETMIKNAKLLLLTSTTIEILILICLTRAFLNSILSTMAKFTIIVKPQTKQEKKQ